MYCLIVQWQDWIFTLMAGRSLCSGLYEVGALVSYFRRPTRASTVMFTSKSLALLSAWHSWEAQYVSIESTNKIILNWWEINPTHFCLVSQSSLSHLCFLENQSNKIFHPSSTFLQLPMLKLTGQGPDFWVMTFICSILHWKINLNFFYLPSFDGGSEGAW